MLLVLNDVQFLLGVYLFAFITDNDACYGDDEQERAPTTHKAYYRS
jgi:hypothetical protein